MDRNEWLKQLRRQAEQLYDHLAPAYWVKFGLAPDETHRRFLAKFLEMIDPHSTILDAACGAGRYDGLLLEAGHEVLGIDQSGGMLEQARAHFPQDRYPLLQYRQMGLQEIDFQAEFDGAICIDALEHIPPEDLPGILTRLRKALKPGGALYVTFDSAELGDYRSAYERAKAQGLPVVFGEVVDELAESYSQALTLDALDEKAITGAKLDHAVYHFHPTVVQIRAWYAQAGLAIETEGIGDEYLHMLARAG